MKNKIIIPIHSILDVITNSSSELFIIDENKGIETVQVAVDELIDKYGMQYEDYGRPSVYECNPSYYDDYNFSHFDDSEIITHLERKGYKVERPEQVKEPNAIIVEWERGSVCQRFISEMETLFETTVISH